MSNFILEIIDPSKSYLQVETSFIDNVNNIEIERFETFNLEIVNTEKILIGDLPDIPVSKIIGNWPVDRIDGLDQYITDNASVLVENVIGLPEYLDDYEFDCGTP